MVEDTRPDAADRQGVGTLPTGAGGPSLDLEDDADSDESVGGLESPPDPDDMPRKKAGDEDETRPLTLPPVDLDVSRVGDKRLLEMAIECSPDPLFPGRHLPATRFASDIALCNDRTLRRYQEGTRGLPNLLRRDLREIVIEAQKKAQRKAGR